MFFEYSKFYKNFDNDFFLKVFKSFLKIIKKYIYKALLKKKNKNKLKLWNNRNQLFRIRLYLIFLVQRQNLIIN